MKTDVVSSRAEKPEAAQKQRYTFTDILTRLVVVVMVVFLISIMLRFVTMDLIEKLQINNAFTRAVMFDRPELLLLAPTDEVVDVGGTVQVVGDSVAVPVDWAALYPFTQEEQEEAAPAGVALPPIVSAVTSRYQALIDKVKTALDLYTTGILMLHDQAVETGNRYDALLGWELPGGNDRANVMTLSDGYLSHVCNKTDSHQYAANMAGLNDFLAQQGTPFLYMQLPYKIDAGDTDFYGVFDFSNQDADELLASLKELGVDTFDLRIPLKETGLNHHSCFFRSDHHWRPETALWAAGMLGEHLNQAYGLSIDTSVYQKDQYTYEVYKDVFLGSQGQKVTLARATPDDITLIYPKFPTNLSIQIPSLGLEKRGDFSIMYRFRPGKAINYAVYFYEDQALTHVINYANPNGNKLLVIGDSFDNAMVPFLSLGVSQLDSLDLRYFTGSLEEYLRQNTYDAVIVNYNPSMISSETATWNFK